MRGNFIILSFVRYAGGKFISNCLSLSRYCCPQDPESSMYLIDHPDDYEYRLNSVLRTLPTDKADMINWIPKYEFGDKQLYGPAVLEWQKGIKTVPNELTTKLLEKNFRLFLTAHGGDGNVRNLVNVWPESTIIKLINHTKFSEIAMVLKSIDNKSLNEMAGNYCKQKYQELAGIDWPSWEEFEKAGFDIRNLKGYDSVREEITSFYNWKDIDNTTLLFNVDDSIFSETKFLSEMQKLYIGLGLDDFNANLILKFWQSYMALHVDKSELMQ